MQIDINKVACTDKIDAKYNHKGFDTAVPETISKNPYLSLADIAVLVYILSNRVNAKKNRWDLHESEVIHHFALSTSKYKITKVFKDLQKWGYLIKRCIRNRKGQYVSTGKWIFLRHPTRKNIRKVILKDRQKSNLQFKNSKSRLPNSRCPKYRKPNFGFQAPNMTQANMTQINIDQSNIQQQQLPKSSNLKNYSRSKSNDSYAVAQTHTQFTDSHYLNTSYRSNNTQNLNLSNKKKRKPKRNIQPNSKHLTNAQLDKIDYATSLARQAFHITPTRLDLNDICDWCSKYSRQIIGYGIDYTVNQNTKGVIRNPIRYTTAVLAHGWYVKYENQIKAQHRENETAKQYENLDRLNVESNICNNALQNYKHRQISTIFQHKSTDKTMEQASKSNVDYKQLYERTFKPVENTEPMDKIGLSMKTIFENFDQLRIYSCGASFALALLLTHYWSLNDIKLEFKHIKSQGYKGLKAMDAIRNNIKVSAKQ